MDNEQIRTRIEELIEEHGADYAGLSRLLGRNAAYIQQYVKRGVPRVLAEADRRKLARFFRVPGEELGLEPLTVQSDAGALMGVPHYNVRASAGHGSFTDDDSGVVNFGFSSQWLKRNIGARSDDLSIIRVDGDSMFPTLADGDDIMVDRSAADGKIHDGIYVIRTEDTLIVKRITVHPAGTLLTISSDNPAYARWPECSAHDIHIIGRVVWAGRKVR